MEDIKKEFEAVIKFEEGKNVFFPHMEMHETFITDKVKGKKIVLDKIMYAKFGSEMYLGTIEIDKDNMMYVLVPTDCLIEKTE
jgi:hypothetical protein